MKNEYFQLVEKCKIGEIAAKEWLYKTYAPLLLGICRRYIPNKMQAEDILHESFISIFDKINTLKNDNALEGWMKRIVVNNALKYLNAQSYEYDIDGLEIEDDNSQNNDDIKSQIQQLELSQDDMLQIVNGLPAGFRTVFNLYVFEHYKHNEIAKELGISSGTSRSQLLRARKLIQQELLMQVQKQKTAKKKDEVYLSSLLLLMTDDLRYIDTFVLEKLNGFAPTPSAKFDFINQGAGAIAETATSAIKQKLLFLVTQRLFWISVITIAGSVIFFVTKTNTQKIDSECVGVLVSKEFIVPQTFENDMALVPFQNREWILDEPSFKNEIVAKKDTVIRKVVHRKVIKKKVVTVKKE